VKPTPPTYFESVTLTSDILTFHRSPHLSLFRQKHKKSNLPFGQKNEELFIIRIDQFCIFGAFTAQQIKCLTSGRTILKFNQLVITHADINFDIILNRFCNNKLNR